MKIRIWEMIVFAVSLVCAITFGAINYLWSGFVYFTVVSLLTFIGFFINNRIYYLKLIKQEYDEGLQLYFTELYNNGLITKEQFQEGDIRIINGYYKDYRRTKNLTIILICGLVFVSLLIALTVFGIW